MGKLQDKVAIITGGASGIGAATAQLFVAEGAKVVLVDLNEEKGQAFAAELQAAGAKAIFIKANVTDENEVAAIYQTTIETFGKIDVLLIMLELVVSHQLRSFLMRNGVKLSM